MIILADVSRIRHPSDVRRTAVALLREGIPNADVARRLGVPPSTVGVWKHRDRRGSESVLPKRICPMCDDDIGALNCAAYAYLLGLYLGDGHIVRSTQWRAYALTIACADAWPGLMDEAVKAIYAVFPHNRVSRARQSGCTSVKSYSQHWPCLFPQHGPGRKHTRRIELAPWQAAIVEDQPERFIRGLIHSDGCRSMNWTEKRVNGELKRYWYPRYFFVNESADIRDLYTRQLDRLGIAWAYTRRNCVSVARRESVARLDSFVGPKY